MKWNGMQEAPGAFQHEKLSVGFSMSPEWIPLPLDLTPEGTWELRQLMKVAKSKGLRIRAILVEPLEKV